MIFSDFQKILIAIKTNVNGMFVSKIDKNCTLVYNDSRKRRKRRRGAQA